VNITKKPKKVAIIYKTVISYQSTYLCPSCHTTFLGAGIAKNILRFKCDCGQELIVSGHKEE
jgi:hypothetical protein